MIRLWKRLWKRPEGICEDESPKESSVPPDRLDVENGIYLVSMTIRGTPFHGLILTYQPASLQNVVLLN